MNKLEKALIDSLAFWGGNIIDENDGHVINPSVIAEDMETRLKIESAKFEENPSDIHYIGPIGKHNPTKYP